MSRYILHRLFVSISVLFLVSVITFALMRIIPGDVVTMKLMESADSTGADQLRHQLGLDKPLPVQYLYWLGNMLRGDLGVSLWTGNPVTEEIAQVFPVSLELALLAIVIAVAIALPAGLISAVYQHTWIDYLVRLVSVAGLAIPPFWLGTLFIMVPALLLGWAPPAGYISPLEDLATNLVQFVFPALALGYFYSAFSMRMTRSQALEVVQQDYIRTARAKGVSEGMVIMRHVLRNVLIPVITLTGTQLSALLGGVVIIEQIFSLPGMGRLTLWAISVRDYPQLQANVMLIGVCVVFINMVIDITYAFLDPRLRTSS